MRLNDRYAAALLVAVLLAATGLTGCGSGGGANVAAGTTPTVSTEAADTQTNAGSGMAKGAAADPTASSVTTDAADSETNAAPTSGARTLPAEGAATAPSSNDSDSGVVERPNESSPAR